VAQIAGSIREFGFTNPVLIDPEGGIIAGHGRVLASPNGLQTGVADRNARRFPFASASTLRGSTRRRFCRAYSPSLLGCSRFPPELCQNTFGDFQLIEFAAQFFPLGAFHYLLRHAPILEVALPELVEGFQLLELQSLQREVLG
jgi:hypothetical protein